MISFTKLSKNDFNLYSKEVVEKIAKEYETSGRWSKEESIQISMEAMRSYLPDGIDTKDNYLLNIINDGKKVGMIWFGKVKEDEVFIYDFNIYTNFQRMGYGEKALIFLETYIKSLGFNKISLHVFGHNKAALSLYEKLGYNAFSINMSKSI